MRTQVIGLCRFSMLTENAFQTTGRDLQRNREILYDSERLDQRMRWFENLCLPPLMRQTDPDFLLIVATGLDLPDPWLSRLREIAAAVPQIRLEQIAPALHGRMCKDALDRHSEPDADVIAQFRMDDDDAVALDYVAQIRSDQALIAPLLERGAPVAVNHTRGFVLQQHPDRRFELRTHQVRLWVTGLTVYFTRQRPGSIMNYRHDELWQKLATLSLAQRPMWIRGIHATNDSPVLRRKPAPFEMTEAEIDETLRHRFGLDRAALIAALAGQGGDGREGQGAQRAMPAGGGA